MMPSLTPPSPSYSYMTTTFMIEAMAAANAQLRWKRREQEQVSRRRKVVHASLRHPQELRGLKLLREKG